MNDTFNPMDWIEDEQPKKPEQPKRQETAKQPSAPPTDISSEVDTVISRIETALTDITTSYQDWLNVGFAFANEFGEGGRGLFHRVSKYYSGYTKAGTDRQFDQCLKSTPSSRCITIRTFFHLAKQAGIDVNTNEAWQESNTVHIDLPDPDPVELPTLPDFIFEQLPEFLQKVVEGSRSKEERDILILGALGVLSACFPKLSGTYDDRKIFANLFLFVTAQASAGKGSLNFCKQLADPIHWELRQELKHKLKVYDMEMREYNMAKMKDPNVEKPEKPPELMFYIPANNSATGVFQILADNEGRGMIFETEGDTMTQAFKSDHGNYSDGFRKAFHHEIISYYRRTDREYREIIHPCVSTILSGSPQQVSALIPSAENGLFSRFIFYHVNMGPLWKNVFIKRKNRTRVQYFDDLGQEFFGLYKTLRDQPEMQFCLTEEQEEEFNNFFSKLQDKYLVLQSTDYIATVRRLGLIAFRMAMIFTALRIMETGNLSETQVCQNEDFQSALAMVSVLIRHASFMFSQLPEDVKITKPKDKKEQFLDALPEKFNYKGFVDIAKSVNILPRSAERYIALFCDKGLISRDQHGSYTNRSFLINNNNQ